MTMNDAKICPVCGKFKFESSSMDICEVCGWQDDPIQRANPDEEECANELSLNEYKKRYMEGALELSPDYGEENSNI